MSLLVIVSCLLLAVAPIAGTAAAAGDSAENPLGTSDATPAAGSSDNTAPAPPSNGTLLVDDKLGENATDIDEVRISRTQNYVYFHVDYDGFDRPNPAVFIDVDRDTTTGYDGTNGAGISYYMDNIGADYVIAPNSGFVDPVNRWNASTNSWGGLTGGQTLDYNRTDSATQTQVFAVERSKIGNPGTVDILVGNAPSLDYSTWDWAPSRGDGHVTVDLNASGSQGPVSVSAPSSAGTAQPGGSFDVTYEYTNTGSTSASAGRIELDTPANITATSVTGDGTSGLGGTPQSVLYGFSGSIQPGQTLTTTITYEVDPNAATGQRQITVEAFKQGNTTTATASTQVSISNVVARYDTNGTPGIQPREAQAAIVDLNNGNLRPRQAQQVIVALNS